MEAIFNSRTFIDENPNISQTSPLDFIDEEQLKKSCKLAPDKIPCFLAKNKNLLEYKQEKAYPSWSSFALFLFDQYGEDDKLIDSISMNLGSLGGVGSLVNYFERMKKLMEELKNNKHKKVRDFAESEISRLEKHIKYEKEREKERDEFNIW